MKSPSKRTLRRRVFVTLLPLLALVLAVGGVGAALIQHLGHRVDEILRENHASVVAMQRLDESLERIDSSFQFALAGREATGQYTANWRSYDDALALEARNVTLPDEGEAVERLRALTERYRNQGGTFFGRAAGAPQRASDYFGPGGLLQTFQAIKSVSGEIRRMNQETMEAASRRAKATAALSTSGLAVGLALAGLVCAILAWNTSRSLIGPIKELTESATATSKGNLEQRVSYAARDELGALAEAFNTMLDQLRASRHAFELRTEELEKAEEKYRSIFENAIEGIFQSTPAGRYVTANRALAEMLGYESGLDLMKQAVHIGEQIYADPERRVELKRRLVHDGLVRDFEALCVRKDKSTVWLSFNTRAVRGKDGAVRLYEGFVTDITSRKQAEQEVSRLAHLNAVVAELGQRALRLDPSADIQEEAIKLVATTLGVELANVMELLPDAKTFLLRAGVGWSEGLVGRAIVSGEGSQPGFTLKSDHAVIVENAATETRFIPVARILEEKLVSSVSVVIPMRHGAYGTLGAHARRRRKFTTDEIDFLQSIANVLGAAIERRRAEHALSASEKRLNRAQEIAHIGSWRFDIPGNRIECSDEVFRIFEVPKGPLITYEFFLAHVHPADRERVDKAWSAAKRGATYDVEHRIIVDTASAAAGRDGAVRVRWVRERAEVVFDASGTPVEGVGTVQDITERRLADDRLRQLNRAHRALSRCNRALVRAHDEPTWMQHVCRLIVDEAGYRLCWLGRAEQDEAKSVRPMASSGFDEGYLVAARITWADTERGRGPTGTCIRTGRLVTSKDITSDPLFAPWREEALRRGYASILAIPIVLDGEPFGALTIYAAEPDAFADDEVTLLTELADDLAYGIVALRTRTERDSALYQLSELNSALELRVAARTADLRAAHEREARIGANIQRQLLLDQPPRDVPGLDVAAITMPSQQIGGDFYGFFGHEGRNCLDLLVADVMGKGVPAALLAAATKNHFPVALWHLLATSGPRELPEPREIVTLAHAHLAHHLIDFESFVTLCYARIDVAARRMDFVDCGHTGVLHVRQRTAECDILHGEDLPLGIREGEIYGQVSVPLEPDDVLVFYSDGVTEARNLEGDFFGVDRLVACVLENRTLAPEALVESVRSTVTEFARGLALPDDLTCVVAKLVPCELPIARADVAIGSALGSLHQAREFVEVFCRTLPDQPLGDDELASLVLAVHEAVSNIMKHGYHGRDDQRLDLMAEAFRDRVAIRLRYQGMPFDPSRIPPPSFDGSRESGFGVFMINSSVDSVRYYSDDLHRSCIRLEKRRDAARSGGPVAAKSGSSDRGASVVEPPCAPR